MVRQKINVAHIRTSHGVFGAERVILGLLKASDKERFRMNVILVGNEPGLNDSFMREITALGINLQNFLFKRRIDCGGIKKLRRYIMEQGFDVIHCHDFKANFYGLLATLGTRVKRVTTVHGSTKDSLLLLLYLGLNEYIIIRFFDKIIAVSDHLAKELRGKLISANKIAVVPNGVDLNFFDAWKQREEEDKLELPTNKTIIGIVGRLFPDKGHRDLFMALNLLQNEFPNLVLMVVGTGPDEPELRLLCKKMRLHDKVIFVGVRHNMKEVFEALDFFAMPSIREGLPLALLEAMLAEKPVVATRVGGMTAVLGEGKRGRAVDANDPEGLANEIRYLLSHRPVADQMAKEAALFVRSKYSAEAMEKRTESIYFKVLEV